ncbi:MAG: hypothetical protein A3C84_04550 [Candidatus Ryanbacteria bacterium RIFCSPHIGHO2_02_FULL_48_12]|uniref:DUF378 domain-containing protein n=1 Tax=Candidatus Ryanbacteria bacterium RIFCSPHIGHO2_01_FULL_48_27 TaxID=1802115 RepID=A0A1G2G676_9BACT|nr:MAG: hypothetical protein A2756_02250 [Candidatus Ryanbacteria bacterium RIFCSPHIGHO2_01_FULL_48_27]OGZ49849.1 MAG: hypothetical protein A3C84_04550 [Candidatus Ryanbacteria bacterium RIFCSPHIGHO2_02_FULL_48_12]
MKLHTIAFILLIIGGLNWLLMGLVGWEVGEIFGGSSAMISRIIYILVGLSAVYEIATHKGRCKECDAAKSSSPSMPSMPSQQKPM